jgi:hypothetical protein
MKQITKNTILKQGDKTFQPIEVDSVVYWVDETILIGMKGDRVIETHNPIVTTICEINRDNADLRIKGYKDMKIVAQSQPKLERIPVVYLDIALRKMNEALTFWGTFDGEKQQGIVYGIKLCMEHYKSNPNQYTQKDIEKAIKFTRGSNEPMEEILEQINYISVIEVDEHFNIISYE